MVVIFLVMTSSVRRGRLTNLFAKHILSHMSLKSLGEAQHSSRCFQKGMAIIKLEMK